MAQEQAGSSPTNGTNTSSTNASSVTTTPNVTTADGMPQNAAALASAIPLAQLLSKPGALNALTSLTALGGLSDLLGSMSGLGPTVQTTGVHRTKALTQRPRPASNNSNSINSNDMNKLRSERSKFNPY